MGRFTRKRIEESYTKEGEAVTLVRDTEGSNPLSAEKVGDGRRREERRV